MMDLKEAKKYLNAFVFNTMKGAKHVSAKCQCGFESQTQHFYNRGNVCPKCGTPLTSANDYISLSPIGFSDRFSVIKNYSEKTFYKFSILLVYKKGEYSFSFKKKVIKDVFVNEEKACLILFDAHVRDKKDCIKIYNVVTEEEMSKKDFIDQYSDLNYSNYNICKTEDSDIRGNYIKLKCNEYSTSIDLKSSKLIKNLENLQDFCFEPCNEILIKSNIDPCLVEIANKEATNPTDILGIKKYTLRQLVKYPNRFKELKVLEQKLGDKSVPYMDKFVIKDSSWLDSYYANKVVKLILDANLSVEKLYKYIYKEVPMNQYIYNEKTILSHLCDCFEMCKQLGLVFDKAPKALVRYHDTLCREIEICDDEIKDQQIAVVSRKYKDLIKISEYDEEKKRYKDNYSMVLPQSGKDLVMEGKKMHHCVGSYVDKMIRENSIILFLREAADMSRRVATLEYLPLTREIVQIKGPRNTRVSDKAYNYIAKWAKLKNVTIRNRY